VQYLSVASSYFYGFLQYPKIFIIFKPIIYLETARSLSGLNQANRVGVPFR
jgi:hypothetical protein